MKIKDFILDRESIKELTKSMTLIESDGWETKYLNKRDKSEWIKFDLDSDYRDAENEILCKLPKPTQSELIELLINSKELNEISAISCLINDSEFDDDDNLNEFRQELIIELEKIVSSENFKLNKFERERLKTIIYDCDLVSPHNQRDTFEKNHIEIEKDYLYYKNIAERAKRIITIANTVYKT